jgi:Mn-dependent DtxR family transcriptional regulator
MKFSEEKRNSILLYIIEKIEQGEENLSKQVAETFNISRNTVSSYLNELAEKGIICKEKRNSYRLISKETVYHLSRSRNELSSDTYAYENFFKKHISDCTKEAQQIWAYAFSEMVNNVMDHSEAENLDVFISKNYLHTSVTLIDDGIGIFEKIKEHFSYESLDEARCELFKGKLTTDEKNHSGEGIFFSSRMMDSFFILSSGKIFSTDKYESAREHDADMPSKGTAVVMTLSNFTHRRISDIFDVYSNVDGGFTKTRIPMKNIFDSAPVSRSQAKMVCNRLEKFSEAIFDFDGIEWMGQAFAHQLFIVYQNEHPDMILTPEHMNETVEKAYRHVISTDNAEKKPL